MSVSNTASIISYVGNNSTSTTYAIPFYFLDNSHVVVVVRDAAGVETQLSTGALTITGAGDPSGGTVATSSAAYDNTNTIIIYRELPITQPTTITDTSGLPTSIFTLMADRLTMICRDISRQLERSFRFSETSDALDPVTVLTTDINTVFGVNASGDLSKFTGAQLQTLINLTTTLNQPTKTFSNSADRAAAVPDFVGQIGTQQDTAVTYISSGLTAGDWTLVAFLVVSNNLSDIPNAATARANLGADVADNLTGDLPLARLDSINGDLILQSQVFS